jgi:hypothetical protein
VRACPVEDEGAQSLSGIGACVIAENIEKADKDSLIDVERRLSQSTVLAHPRTEFSQHRPEVTGGRGIYWDRKLTLVLEKPNEHRGNRY